MKCQFCFNNKPDVMVREDIIPCRNRVDLPSIVACLRCMIKREKHFLSFQYGDTLSYLVWRSHLWMEKTNQNGTWEIE
jgi:hypothetical protein